jgi:multidrug efflux pump
MVPLSDFATVEFVSGPVMITRYNMYPSAFVHADAGPGTSSGQAITALEQTAKSELPQSMRTEWTELAFLQLQTGNTAMWVFLLAVVLVFLVLAAQYESWALPLAVILVVPMCLLCAVFGVVVAKHDINIFTQIGFLVLVGLACKNAILIVEYAKAQSEAGLSRLDATLAAVKLRLRPIVMTSFAFVFGVIPLMISEGAGAEMRRTLGTAVFAGMLGVTLFGVFLTPVFYYVIQGFKERYQSEPDEEEGLNEHNPVAQFISELGCGLKEIDGCNGETRRFSPEQVATLERGLNRIEELLRCHTNGSTNGEAHHHDSGERHGSSPG